jgi:hypothetical protein
MTQFDARKCPRVYRFCAQWRTEGGAAAPGAGGGAKMGIKTQEKAKEQVLYVIWHLALPPSGARREAPDHVHYWEVGAPTGLAAPGARYPRYAIVFSDFHLSVKNPLNTLRVTARFLPKSNYFRMVTVVQKLTVDHLSKIGIGKSQRFNILLNDCMEFLWQI